VCHPRWALERLARERAEHKCNGSGWSRRLDNLDISPLKRGPSLASGEGSTPEPHKTVMAALGYASKSCHDNCYIDNHKVHIYIGYRTIAQIVGFRV
jgi:hypothetical protein